MFIRAEDPSVADQFFRYFKTETAHAVNKMMGRVRGPVWDEGYDSPIVLDEEKYSEKTVYILTNPQKADLVERIEHYPHLSSWQARLSSRGVKVYECYDIRRQDVPRLPQGELSEREERRLLMKLRAKAKGRKRIKLVINPRAMFETIKDEQEKTWGEHNERVLEWVRDEQLELSKKRILENKSVLGAEKLKRASIHQVYVPQANDGIRTICLASDADERKGFIEWFKDMVGKCKEVYQRWSQGDFSVDYPLGFFPPGGMRPKACMLPAVYMDDY